MYCVKNDKQTCNKHKLANVSSVNECHKIDTRLVPRREKNERVRSRPVAAVSQLPKPWNCLASRTLPAGLPARLELWAFSFDERNKVSAMEYT